MLAPSAGGYRRLARLTLLVGLAACASAGGRSGHSSENAVITQAEIVESHQPTLYDVVRALRPNWLRQQPTAMQMDQETGITVYLDNQRAGGLEVLQEMLSTSATSLHFYTASEAQSRFGLNNLHGVIQITSNGGRSGRN
jgi:hypothetical protein